MCRVTECAKEVRAGVIDPLAVAVLQTEFTLHDPSAVKEL
jgi:hypothetical protein